MLACGFLSTLARETAGAAWSLRAKRSNPSHRVCGAMDCFVASLLAMTAWNPGRAKRSVSSRPRAQLRTGRDDGGGCSPRHTLGVVLAKARTHYPECQLLRDAGSTIPSTIKFGGYGS